MENNNKIEDAGHKSKEGSKKRSNGRRKIPIETITDSTKKHVTFSKRRVGLFKKASELCALCGVEMAILTFSERGKLFCFGHPNPDAVIHRYLKCGTPHCSGPNEDRANEELAYMVEEHNRRYEGIKRKIEEEKKFSDYQLQLAQSNEKDVNKENGGGFWWDEARVDEMGLDELEQFMACLVELRNNVIKRADELSGATLPPVSNQIGHTVVDQINNIDYRPPGFGSVSNVKFSDNVLSYNHPAGMFTTNNSQPAANDDDVPQSFNFGFMNEVHVMNERKLEGNKDFSHFSSPSQGMELAIRNHQVSIMEETGSTLTTPDSVLPQQGFKFGTGYQH